MNAQVAVTVWLLFDPPPLPRRHHSLPTLRLRHAHCPPASHTRCAAQHNPRSHHSPPNPQCLSLLQTHCPSSPWLARHARCPGPWPAAAAGDKAGAGWDLSFGRLARAARVQHASNADTENVPRTLNRVSFCPQPSLLKPPSLLPLPPSPSTACVGEGQEGPPNPHLHLRAGEFEIQGPDTRNGSSHAPRLEQVAGAHELTAPSAPARAAPALLPPAGAQPMSYSLLPCPGSLHVPPAR